ncbi:MAG: hypothetical protein CMO55_27220 [Verrucomicrobiales bacterium]|nr:hypothetical protein [Verrucomicrobiales bacterium]
MLLVLTKTMLPALIIGRIGQRRINKTPLLSTLVSRATMTMKLFHPLPFHAAVNTLDRAPIGIDIFSALLAYSEKLRMISLVSNRGRRDKRQHHKGGQQRKPVLHLVCGVSVSFA